MFDLEQSLTEWRQEMIRKGIGSPVPLEELEGHVREDIERQIKLGFTQEHSFATAVRKIGGADALRTEFARTCVPGPVRLVALAGIGCAVFAGLFLLWIWGNLLITHRSDGAERMLGSTAVGLVILSWWFGPRFFPVVRRPWIRSALGTACCVAGVGGVVLFVKFILPSLFNFPVRSDPPVGKVLVSVAWVLSAMAIFGGMAWGLEKASHKTIKQNV